MKSLKLMWLPDKDMIWNVEDETSLTNDVLKKISKGLADELGLWIDRFSALYKAWLDKDSADIHNIKASDVQKGIELSKKIGKEVGKPCYYWFDLDRSQSPDYVWASCPNCGTGLIEHNDWDKNNRFTCEKCLIVMPK